LIDAIAPVGAARTARLNTALFTLAGRTSASAHTPSPGTVMTMVPQSFGPTASGTTAFCRICGPALRQQFPNCAHLKPRRQALMRSRPPRGREDRVPMIRWIATITAGALLSAALALLHPAAQAAPQPAPQSTPQSVQQPAPDAVSPLQLPPPTSNRKAHNGSGRPAAGGNVMRGSDTPSLVAMLPWWRPDQSHPPGSDPGELESPILTACDLWLGFPYATADAQSLTVRLAAAQHAGEIDLVANRIRVIDPGELNEIDLAAPEEPQSNGRPWLLSGLLTILGGALAAFSAVRYLVA
jgi:hypothetical protein